VEILHVVLLGIVKYLLQDFMAHLSKAIKNILAGYLESFNTASLNLPALQPKYLTTHVRSLIGKEFKNFLQAAPFVLFQFMNDAERALWLSLSHLSTYVFQTHIHDMTTFQNNLKTHISIFMHHLVKSNAQWINKPKFHMLTHLPASILRFGPAPLFATKKFESYNGILRNASTHSNRLAPGRNIAIKFGNFHALRSVLSGGVSYNQKTQTTSNASPQVLNIFQNTPSIQNSMGYDAASYQFAKQFPFESPVHQPTDELPIPPSLRTQFPLLEFRQINCLQLNRNERIRNGHFVLVGILFSTSLIFLSRCLSQLNSINHF
jgi:hypothetical protein